MSEFVFLTHLPLLRIDAESVPFGRGDLWRMPFDRFDQLTVGAFTDHGARYEAAAPVFYRLVADLPLPILRPREVPEEPGRHHVLELKMASNNWGFLSQLGLDFVVDFQDFFVDPAWRALLLTVPATALPQPRTSVCFAISQSDDAFHLGDNVSRTIRVQGDADIEFVLLAEAAGAAVLAEAVAKASALVPGIEQIREVPEFRAALESLEAATAPPLHPAEQLTLSVVGLEALLFPDVKSGLGATFKKRLSRLLAADSEHSKALVSVAERLYTLRSVELHGGELDEAAPEISDAYGQQLLAAAVLAMSGKDEPLDRVRSELDKDDARPESSDRSLPSLKPAGLRRYERLLRSSTERTTGFSVGQGASSLGAPEGVLLSWSPLLGLRAESMFRMGEEGAPAVVPLTGQEVLTLEDKDIRRDFISQLNVTENTVAALAIAKKNEGEEFSYERIGPDELLRKRDLAVAALRLAGFTKFYDPELLGSFVFDGTLRYRRATVLRQTILQDLRVEQEEQIGPADVARTGPLWQLLEQYDGEARHSDVDAVLRMLRRTCDRRFLPASARAGLMFGALEAMLGRSRPPKEKVQLDTLVTHLAGDGSAAAKWFAADGRRFRNAVAHGYCKYNAEDLPLLEYVAEILRVVVPAYVRCWVGVEDRESDRPGHAFINQLTKEL